MGYRINIEAHCFDRDREAEFKRKYGVVVMDDTKAPWEYMFGAQDRDKLVECINENWGGPDHGLDLDEMIQEGPVPSYSTEFPDFELDVEIPYGFRDESWHNDTCPSWCYQLEDKTHLKLYIDYKAPARREMPGARFALELYDHEMDHINSLDQTDDYREICIEIRAQIIKAEIIEKMQAFKNAASLPRGYTIPPTVRRLSQVDDYCDVNELGGFSDDEYPTPRDANGDMTDEHLLFRQLVHERVDQWLHSLPADFDPGPHVDTDAVPVAAADLPAAWTTQGVGGQASLDKMVRYNMFLLLKREFEPKP